MPQDPFPARGPDGEEPDGSRPLPPEGNGPGASGLGNGGQEDNWDGDAHIEALLAAAEAGEDEAPPEEGPQGPAQGLYVCLPAEDLTLAGFARGGQADTMGPGPLLAAVVHAVTGPDGQGLAALDEDQLIGVISAARRTESRAAWTQLAAVREFAARRPDRDRTGAVRAGFSEFAADELVAEFNLSWPSAAEQIAYACAVAERLPRTFAALAAGRIHPVHVKIIEDETRILSPQDAARADEVLAEAAQSKSFGQLRSAAHRLVLKLDPDSAQRRKAAAKRETHVRRFREDSGNAGMIAREMPPDEVLASWQHVEQRALDLRAAGVPGTLQELLVKAYLDLLQERDSRDTPAGPDPGETGTPGGTGAVGTDGPDDSGPAGTGTGRPGLAYARWPDLRHHAHRIPHLMGDTCRSVTPKISSRCLAADSAGRRDGGWRPAGQHRQSVARH